MAKREGKIFQHGRSFVHSGGSVEVVEYNCVEVVEYDYEDLVSVIVGGSVEAFECLLDHLWLVCGGVSAASALW